MIIYMTKEEILRKHLDIKGNYAAGSLEDALAEELQAMEEYANQQCAAKEEDLKKWQMVAEEFGKQADEADKENKRLNEWVKWYQEFTNILVPIITKTENNQ